jgi:preprotein translocase subunit SecG
MEAVIIVIHLMVIVALIAVVLLQRSEGGALGIGGGNAFLTGRGQGNILTRATTFLGIAFFLTSIALTVLSRLEPPPSAILNTVPTAVAPPPAAPGTTTPAAGGGILDQLNQFTNQNQAPGAGAAPTPLLPGLTPNPLTGGPQTPAAPAPPAPTAPATPAPNPQ